MFEVWGSEHSASVRPSAASFAFPEFFGRGEVNRADLHEVWACSRLEGVKQGGLATLFMQQRNNKNFHNI